MDQLDPDGRRRAEAAGLIIGGVVATAPLWSKTQAKWTKEQLESQGCVRRVVDRQKARISRLTTGADCFKHCKTADGQNSRGFCGYCGSDALCCKRNHASDPEECKRVMFWPSGTNFHTCVPRSRYQPIYSLVEVSSQMTCGGSN